MRVAARRWEVAPPYGSSPRRDTNCHTTRARLTTRSGTYRLRINQVRALAVSDVRSRMLMRDAFAKSTRVSTTNSQTMTIAARERVWRRNSAASARTPPATSPQAICCARLSGMRNPERCAEKTWSATLRNAWIHNGTLRATARVRRFIHGAAYHTA